MFTPITSILKPAKQGVVSIDHITLRPETIMLDNMRYARDGNHFMRVEPGNYARLVIRGRLVMSDTQMERLTNTEFITVAHGHVLIGGLGIGLVLTPLIKKKEVKSITVVELEQDLIAIVADKYQHAKLTVVQGDIHNYVPAQKFDTIYLDIWPDLNTDNLTEIAKLKRRYRKWLNKENPSSWIGCWPEKELRSMKRRGW